MTSFASNDKNAMKASPLDQDDSHRRSIAPNVGRAETDIETTLDQLWGTQSDRGLGLPPGSRIGGYTIDRAMGFGSFGVIYKAWDESAKRDVAIKVPRLDLQITDEKRLRFAAEAAALSRMDDDGIVGFYELDLDSKPPFLAMEFCDGCDLESWLNLHPLPRAEVAARFVQRAARSIAHAHRQGVVHRDLKPSNLMLVPHSGDDSGIAATHSGDLDQYQVRITDFGLALLAEEPLIQTRSSLVLGTPLFMAPEQFLGDRDRLGPPTDVFVLGIILYRLLTGELPFAADSYPAVVARLLAGDPKRPREIDPDIPRSLETICMTCLQTDVDHRYQTADALADDLSNFASGGSIRAKAPNIAQRLARRLSRRESIDVACRWVQAISVVRGAYGMFGLGALVVLEETTVTQEEVVDALMSICFVTYPYEFAMFWGAGRLRRGRLPAWGYYALLVATLALATITAVAMMGIFVPSKFYQRAVFARVIAFSMIFVLFTTQTIAWLIARRRLSYTT